MAYDKWEKVDPGVLGLAGTKFTIEYYFGSTGPRYCVNWKSMEVALGHTLESAKLLVYNRIEEMTEMGMDP